MQGDLFSLEHCTACPRRCGADRTRGPGRCGAGERIKVARAALHQWEEPVISGQRGSGTVFFTGCNLGCCFCQNYPVSQQGLGKEIDPGRLEEIFFELAQQGAHNINLVTPTPQLPLLLPVLQRVKSRLRIPVVYNCGGYERVEALQRLEGLVDIYLPDLKYFSPALAQELSGAADYFAFAAPAILEMFRQVGPPVVAGDGLLQRGLVVRHLALPGCSGDSLRLIDWLAENLPGGGFYLSLMSQYLPIYKSGEHPRINRRLFSLEYNKLVRRAEQLGLEKVFLQQRQAADSQYIPPFDLQGV